MVAEVIFTDFFTQTFVNPPPHKNSDCPQKHKKPPSMTLIILGGVKNIIIILFLTCAYCYRCFSGICGIECCYHISDKER